MSEAALKAVPGQYPHPPVTSHVGLLTSTRQYYEEDTSRRAVYVNDNGVQVSCAYRTSDGKACAVGRFMSDECATHDGVQQTQRFKLLPFHCKPECLRALDSIFVEDIQSLHDREEFWNEKGLTTQGNARYVALMKEARFLDIRMGMGLAP